MSLCSCICFRWELNCMSLNEIELKAGQGKAGRDRARQGNAIQGWAEKQPDNNKQRRAKPSQACPRQAKPPQTIQSHPSPAKTNDGQASQSKQSRTKPSQARPDRAKSRQANANQRKQWQGFILGYRLDDRATFTRIRGSWMPLIMECLPSQHSPPALTIVANKCDLDPEKWTVTTGVR